MLSRVALLVIGAGLGALVTQALFVAPHDASRNEAAAQVANAPQASSHTDPAGPVRPDAAPRMTVQSKTSQPSQRGVSASDDLSQAIASIQQLTNRLDKARAIRQLVAQLLKTDPQAAAKLALSLDPSLERDNVIGLVARSWGASDPAAAIAWAQDLSPSLGRNRAVQEIVTAWAASDPRTAANFLLTQPQGNLFNSLASTLAAQWATTDPGGAGKWVLENLTGQAQNNAVAALAVAWARKAPVDAANFAPACRRAPPKTRPSEAL